MFPQIYHENFDDATPGSPMNLNPKLLMNNPGERNEQAREEFSNALK